MSESMQAPSYSRRIWLAFAVCRGKGWAAAKAEPVSAHRWRAGEHGKGRVHRDRSLPRQARGGGVRRRLGRAGEMDEAATNASMGIDQITPCVKILAAAQ